MSKPAMVGLGALCLLLTPGCSSPRAGADSKMYRLGERVEVGQLIYTIMDAEWVDQLGDPPSVRLPRHRFMALRVSVTNSGASTLEVPSMSLIDVSGAATGELSDGQGLRDWLGFVRSLKPAETMHGRVLFDVPAAAYHLKLTNGDPENERIATVDVPLDLSHLPVIEEPAR